MTILISLLVIACLVRLAQYLFNCRDQKAAAKFDDLAAQFRDLEDFAHYQDVQLNPKDMSRLFAILAHKMRGTPLNYRDYNWLNDLQFATKSRRHIWN